MIIGGTYGIKVESVQPGLYVEQVAKMRKVEQHVELWFNINLHDCNDHLTKLANLQKTIVDACRTNALPLPSQHCASLDMITKMKLKNVNDLASRLTPRRPKRALLGFVGEGMSYLYGTMSESEKIALEKRVRSTEDNNQKTMATVKNYGQIMEKTLQQLSGLVESCMSNNSIYEMINKNFNEILKEEELTRKQFELNNFRQQILYSFTYICETLEFFYFRIEHTLNSLKNGILHTELFTLDLILDTLKSAKLAEKSYEFPFEADLSIQEFNKLTKFGVVTIGSKISIIFLVPIINIDTLMIYHTFAVPRIQDGIAKTYGIDDSWIATDKSHEKFFKTTEAELKTECIEIRDEFLCKKLLTWRKKNSCELAVINADAHLMEHLCEKLVYAINSTIIIPLHEKTRILILNPQPVKAKFIGSKNRMLDLGITDIISINETGDLYIDDVVLEFTESEIIKIENDLALDDKIENEFFNTDLNLTNDKVRKLIPIVSKKNVKMSEITAVAMKWHEFNEKLEEKTPEETAFWKIILATILISIILTIAAISYIYLRCHRTAQIEVEPQVNEPRCVRREIQNNQEQQLEDMPIEQVQHSAMGFRRVLSMRI